MRWFWIVLFLFVVLAAKDEKKFSKETRQDDLAFLEAVTLPYRRAAGASILPLIDFLASKDGLLFLTSHLQANWNQETLEFQYERKALCKNANKAYIRNGNHTKQTEQFSKCVCQPMFPFLHCLAIASQANALPLDASKSVFRSQETSKTSSTNEKTHICLSQRMKDVFQNGIPKESNSFSKENVKSLSSKDSGSRQVFLLSFSKFVLDRRRHSTRRG